MDVLLDTEPEERTKVEENGENMRFKEEEAGKRRREKSMSFISYTPLNITRVAESRRITRAEHVSCSLRGEDTQGCSQRARQKFQGNRL
jgi:hypothetical protein